MKKRIQKMFKNEKGLTLVELLAVIVILGIIAAIAVPSIGKIIENTKYNAVKADAINALNAANLYFADDSNALEDATVTVKQLVEGGYLENLGKLGGDVATTPGTGENMIITNATPKIINGTSSPFSGAKTVTFADNTLADINADNTKGSSIAASGSHTIEKITK